MINARPGGYEGRKEEKMYGKIRIKTTTESVTFRSTDNASIYAFLTGQGYDYDVAADVAGWADLTAVGEQYDLDGVSIIITD